MKKKLASYVDLFSKQHLVVLGDVMLDKYIWGQVTRISPEAPVPVVQVTKETGVPGGAANVARNVLSLGGHAELIGVCGDDLNGESLRGLMAGAGAGVRGIAMLKNRPTTVKTRVLAEHQQVVRIDQETTEEIMPRVRTQLRKSVAEFLAQPGCGALILEDYAKGVFSRSLMQGVVDDALALGKIVALDPHPRCPFDVKRMTLMTPNRSEAFALAEVPYRSSNGLEPKDDHALLKVAEILRRRWQPRYLLITLGADGMALFSEDGDWNKPVHIPTVARQVFDVSGAGDTVMATMVLSLLAGANPETAARIANSAAGVVVGRVGTSAIEAEVLQSVLA